jgi:hypothetical protein
MNYYNERRTHLSLDKDAPLSRTVQRAGVFFAFQSWAGCITNIFGFDLRQAQVPGKRRRFGHVATRPRRIGSTPDAAASRPRDHYRRKELRSLDQVSISFIGAQQGLVAPARSTVERRGERNLDRANLPHPRPVSRKRPRGASRRNTRVAMVSTSLADNVSWQLVQKALVTTMSGTLTGSASRKAPIGVLSPTNDALHEMQIVTAMFPYQCSTALCSVAWPSSGTSAGIRCVIRSLCRIDLIEARREWRFTVRIPDVRCRSSRRSSCMRFRQQASTQRRRSRLATLSVDKSSVARVSWFLRKGSRARTVPFSRRIGEALRDPKCRCGGARKSESLRLAAAA